MGKYSYNVPNSYNSPEHASTHLGRREKLSQELTEMSTDNRYQEKMHEH